jgi:hypothetical protein
MTSFTNIGKRAGILVLLMVFEFHHGIAQKINFGAYTTSQDISLTASSTLLNFNNQQPIMVCNTNATVTIALSDNEAQNIKIIADASRDVTVTITSPAYMIIGSGGAGNQIPFTCNVAYSNTGVADASTAKLSAIQVPAGFTVITFPILKRTAGIPLPPPTPAHGGYTAPSATAYLFLYGKFGPIGNVNAGNYTGIVNVSVDYSTN